MQKIVNKILLVLFFVWLTVLVFTPERDGDFWFNVKSGEMIVKAGKVFSEDIFSFTAEGQAWINRLWLFQVMLYGLFKLFSWHGVMALKCVLIVLTFHCLLRRQYKSENLAFILIIAALGALSIQFRVMMRPEIVSFFFLALNIYLLEQYRTQYDPRFLWPLPLLKIVWVNMHGLYVLGFLLDAACLAEMAVLIVINKSKDVWGKRRIDTACIPSWKTLFSFAATELVAVAGLFLNPFSFKGVVVPFEQWRMIGQDSFFLKIQELLPTSIFFLREGFSVITVALGALLVISIILLCYETARTRTLQVFYGMVFIAFCYLGFKINRNLALLSLVAVAIAASIADRIRLTQKFRRPFNMLCLITLLLLFAHRIGWALTMPWTRDPDLRSGATAYLRSPEKVVDFLTRHDITDKIYSNMMLFENYFLWKLGPEKKVFWDGRLEVYGEEFYKEAITSVRLRERFQRLIDKYDFNCLVFAYRSTYESDQDQSIFKRISELYVAEDWKLVYLDSYYCVFVARSALLEGENRDLELTLPHDEKEAAAFTTLMAWHTSPDDTAGRIYEYYSLVKIAIVLGKTALADYLSDRAVASAPNHPYARLLIARRAFKEGDYERAHELYLQVLPHNPQVVLLLAETAFKLKRHEEAIDYLKRFTKRYSYSTSVYLSLADNYYALGDYARAQAILEDILIRDFQNPTARQNYILLLEKMKQRDRGDNAR